MPPFLTFLRPDDQVSGGFQFAQKFRKNFGFRSEGLCPSDKIHCDTPPDALLFFQQMPDPSLFAWRVTGGKLFLPPDQFYAAGQPGTWTGSHDPGHFQPGEQCVQHRRPDIRPAAQLPTGKGRRGALAEE